MMPNKLRFLRMGDLAVQTPRVAFACTDAAACHETADVPLHAHTWHPVNCSC